MINGYKWWFSHLLQQHRQTMKPRAVQRNGPTRPDCPARLPGLVISYGRPISQQTNHGNQVELHEKKTYDQHFGWIKKKTIQMVGLFIALTTGCLVNIARLGSFDKHGRGDTC